MTYFFKIIFLATTVAFVTGCSPKPTDALVKNKVAQAVTEIEFVKSLDQHFLYWNMSTWGDSGGPQNMQDAKQSAQQLCKDINLAADKPDFNYLKANYEDSTKRWGMLAKGNRNDDIFLAASKSGFGKAAYHTVRSIDGYFEAICKVDINIAKLVASGHFTDTGRAYGVVWNSKRPKSISYTLSDMGEQRGVKYRYVDYRADMECSAKDMSKILEAPGVFMPCGTLENRISLTYDSADKSWR